MYKSEYEIKKEICEIGRRIYNDGFVAANDGNISVKIADNVFLATPTGVSKGFMTPEMICKVDGQGNILEAKDPWKPSSEFKMHLRVYQERPDVNSVVHAHPPIATSFAIAGICLTLLSASVTWCVFSQELITLQHVLINIWSQSRGN